MDYTALTREELKRIIEGRGCADRVPNLLQLWIFPGVFGGREGDVRRLLDKYPCDVKFIGLNMPAMQDAPEDDPSYRWFYIDRQLDNQAADNRQYLRDWDEEGEAVLAHFPKPTYRVLTGSDTAEDGRYRVAFWWGFFFERFWGFRGMEDAMVDFYENPEWVHRLFRRLTDFYKEMIRRAHDELHADAIMTSDDLGTQTGTFFSPAIFDEFFAPYYKEIFDYAHSLGMHFWLHACGNIEAFIPKFIDLGLDALHPIQKYTMDERKIAEKYGDRLTFWAGFDVQQTIPYGTVEDVRREARYLIDTYARSDGRFLLTLGNGTTADTPVESLEALFDELFTYGREKCAALKGKG